MYTLYCDPGHAWARVPRAELATLQIAAQITAYSFQRGDYAYLEEDCDLATFIRAYQHTYGHVPAFKEQYSNRDSRIRSYATYKAS
jgi:hypothetical protein